jgi:transcriptional regulator GlxA family with amidase domain
MDKLQRHISARLDDPVDLPALAKVAGLSPRQLERVFTRTTGETPSGYARRLRLERAAVRLRTTRTTILAIAIEAGFESHAAFARMFRARIGHTPLEYRRLQNVTVQPRARAQLWQLAGAALRQHVER